MPKTAALAIPLCVLLAAAAQATVNEPRVHWTCVQERDAEYHASCIARPVPGDPSALDLLMEDMVGPPAAAPRLAPAHAGAHRDLRPVATRAPAEIFSAGPWRVPFYAPPSDAARAHRLLHAVLCGTARYCEVTYRP